MPQILLDFDPSQNVKKKKLSIFFVYYFFKETFRLVFKFKKEAVRGFCFRSLFCFVWCYLVGKINVRSCVSPTATTRQTPVALGPLGRACRYFLEDTLPAKLATACLAPKCLEGVCRGLLLHQETPQEFIKQGLRLMVENVTWTKPSS